MRDKHVGAVEKETYVVYARSISGDTECSIQLAASLGTRALGT